MGKYWFQVVWLLLIAGMGFGFFSAANAEQRVIKVGYCNCDLFFAENQAGSRTGYGSEYLNEISRYTGWRYEYVPGNLEECRERLENGDIDLLCGGQSRDLSAGRFQHTEHPIGMKQAVMAVLSDQAAIFYEDFSNFSGLKVGLVRESYQNVLFEKYAQEHGFTVEKRYYISAAQSREALHNREVDAVVGSGLGQDDGEKIVAQVSAMPVYFFAAPGNAALLDALNDAMGQLHFDRPNFAMYLYEKYCGAKGDSLKLRREDADFIGRCPVLRVVCDNDAIPAEYFDQALGGYAGLHVDILKLIMERGGFSYEFVPAVSFQDGLTKIKNGEADILLSAYQNPRLEQAYDLQVTEPYIVEKNVFIGRKGMQFAELENLTVAIREEDINFRYLLAENYPHWQVKAYATLAECFAAVEDGSSAISLQNMESAANFFARNGHDRIEMITGLHQEMPLGFGVSKKLPPQLIDVLNQVIHSVSKKDLNNLIAKNTINKPSEISFAEFIRKKSLEIAVLFALSIAGVTLFVLRAKRKKDQELDEVTYTDRLTGLKNFEKFEMDATALLLSRNPVDYAVVYIDIEKFKYINESLGYERGNAVLLYFAKLFMHQLYNDELLTRVSGDRFVVLLKYESQKLLADRIQGFYRVFNGIRSTLLESQRLVLVSGIYCLTPEDVDITLAVDRANLARKTIKGAHHHSFVFYDKKIHQLVMKEKEIENVMEKALKQGEFIIYLQPKYDLKTREILGAEALARWKKANGDIIAPDDFIPVFERNGFIIEFDFYIFEKCCALQRKWAAAGEKIIPVAVNFSRLHVNDPRFIERLQKIVSEYGVQPQNLEIEMTESAFAESDMNSTELINQLKSIGFALSMDDFGTGYSSLKLLREVPFDVLKLDKSFLVDKNEMLPKEKILIANIIRMARELNIKVIAEGIETKGQETLLADLLCDMGQGYYFSRPVPVEEFEKMVWKRDII